MRFNKETLLLFYYRYKDTTYFSLFLTTIIVAVCIVIFFQVIIPQVQNWFSIREEITRTRSRISTINQNIIFMNNTNKPLLDEQVSIATGALPTEKNFTAIINALSDSAFSSGVSLNDFNFQVGNVASSEGQLNIFGQKGLSDIRLTINLTGTFDGVSLFLKETQQKLPLSEVVDVSEDTFTTTITLRFYQKQFPQIVFKDDQQILPFSASDLSLIQKLSSWQPSVAEEGGKNSESGINIPLF